MDEQPRGSPTFDRRRLNGRGIPSCYLSGRSTRKVSSLLFFQPSYILIFLHFHSTQCSSFFPPGFIDETLRTMALLFPAYPTPDNKTRNWLSRFSANLSIDHNVIQCGHLKTDDRQIERFVFWHDRIVSLKQVYDEAQPRSLSQWWYDRRNGVQWYTFWVALLVLILTLLFGLIQCIEGAMQVYMAYSALLQQGRPSGRHDTHPQHMISPGIV
jgi:hypothetical protein